MYVFLIIYSNEWFTHDQLTKAGYVIKEEEHGTPVFNHKLVDTEGKKQKVLRYYLVFNKDQLKCILEE